MPPESRRPLHYRATTTRARRQLKAIEMTYSVTLFCLFIIFGSGCLLCVYLFEFPNWVIVILVIVFVCIVALLTIALGLFGQRRRMIRRVRRHHLMHAGRHDVYTLPSMFFPAPPPAFPPLYTDQMRIPRPTLIRTQRLLVPPNYEQLFGENEYFSPPGPGAPPSYASMDRPARRSTDRSSFSPPPGYEERREEGVEIVEMGEERVREETVIEITEEIIEENNNEMSIAGSPSIVKVIDCSKALPQVFEIPQHESLC